MRSRIEFVLSVFLLSVGAILTSCSKDEPDSSYVYSDSLFSNPSTSGSGQNPLSLDPGIIQNEVVTYNQSFSVIIPSTTVFKWKEDYHFDLDFKTRQEIYFGLIDLHLEVLPLYVFGTESYSGDYYSVMGYAVAHNAACFKEEAIYTENNSDLEKIGWYMGDFDIDAQLLDEQGNPVTNDKVGFLVTPEPSTTIGETTYKKGFTFSFSPAVTFGKVRKVDEDDEVSWKTIGLGAVSFGFKWENSSSQVLPDQSVMMWTGPEDRSVSYNFKTNNLEKEDKVSAIPAVARNDQRVDFSWVWKVNSGAYAAQDNSFGHMKMKVTISPKYETNVHGFVCVKYLIKDGDDKAEEKTAETSVNNYFIGTNVEPIVYEVDLPAMNRIPTAKFTLKNCTTSYMTNIEVYRTGEYGQKDAYDAVYCVCAKNESVEDIIRKGTYDIVYELKNGDTGESRGKFMIQKVEFDANADLSLTTFDGQKIQ